MDHYAAFHTGEAQRRIERTERNIIARADVVLATSSCLAAHLRKLHPNVVQVPNGVDCKVFSQTAFPKLPEWRQSIRSPVIGFYGTLGDWLNYPLLESLATARPQWTFVFIGPVASRRALKLMALQNVIHVPPVPYRDLPAHAAGFDVAMVPFELNELTLSVHPLKALEYLAAGLPTVSTPLPDLADLAAVMRFAKTLEEWICAIEQSLAPACRLEQPVAARRAAVASLSWDGISGHIDGIVQSATRSKLKRDSILRIGDTSQLEWGSRVVA